ncbi:alpha/beta-hydrolase [Annulohypoxylon moriforme]|nr:alpha/beta-hydrolase [Annulohypoxylon moriforme]
MPETIHLPHKPDSPLSYQFIPGQGSSSTSHLVVFLNGLILTQEGWKPSIEDLQRRWSEKNVTNHPPLLTYDRFGQGKSARDPTDPEHDDSHSISEVVNDLYVLVREVWRHKILAGLGQNGVKPDSPPVTPSLVFVSNSIGCVIARLFADTYPRTVEALLMLDSNIANSDLVSIFPDPDSPSFDPSALPADMTIEDLRRTRTNYCKLFHPSARNLEGLDRRNIADLLPESDAPKLVGPDGESPWITVVGHDWNTFADEGERGSMNVPKSLTNMYMNPAWTRYNEGLVCLTDEPKARGPVTAVGCGHFIQRDDPILVAELVEGMLEKLVRQSWW